jgi:SAM-dependent methyltransferase
MTTVLYEQHTTQFTRDESTAAHDTGFSALTVADDADERLSLGMMSDLGDTELLEAWNRVLDIQTRGFGPREVQWLRDASFGAAGRAVLEVGSGDGNYGRFLAASFPETRVHGLEPTQAFIERGIDAYGELPANYTITPCRVGDEPIPGAEDATYGDCLLRYVLQHSSDPVRVLRGVYDALPVGGRVFVIEEDSALFVSTEEWPAFAAFVDRLERVYVACGSDFQTGRKLHVLAREAGFEVEDFRIGLRTSVDLGTDLLDWLIGMTHMLHHSNPSILTRDDLELIVGDFTHRRDTGDTTVFCYPQVMMIATKPLEP